MKSQATFFDAILHGGDYNPEQWPEAVWDEDARLMREAHVNVATVPVFGWVHLQPDEETYCFEWLDKVIEKLHNAGVGVCLATATASVPAWLDQKYPDVLRVLRDGRRRKHGDRHTFCPHSPNFRRLSVELARRLAERYGNHPALKIWHVSNEYGNYCYCDLCAAAFRVWLQERYGTLEKLNERWYTAFWGQTYTDWSQIDTPTNNGQGAFQAIHIDYDRFQSQSILESYRAEAEVLRAATPHIPITTNLMGAFKPLDYHRWAREMDIVSWDSYPPKGAQPAEIAFNHSLMRGLKEGQPFMLMEQTPSQQNWQAYNALKRPGVMRLWSYQAMAHGADTIMYFQWRRSRGAQEKYHGAVVEHVGTADTRVFREVATLGQELASLGTRTLGGRVAAKVAILFDWENWWAIEYSSGPTVDLKYVPQCRAYFRALHDLHIPTDIVSPEADLSGYDLVIAPVLYMVKPGIAEKLEAFVKAGGAFVTTFFSGLVDENDLVYLGGYPGPLRKLLGIWAEEIDALPPGQTNRVVLTDAAREASGVTGDDLPCGLLCDRIHLEGATALATYSEDFYAGEPAITVNQFGNGEAYYLATHLHPNALKTCLAALLKHRHIEPPITNLPAEVEVMPRVAPDGQTLLYLLNHGTDPATVDLPTGRYTDLLTGQAHEGQISLDKYGVSILAAE